MTNSVNILALETSSPVLSVAVRREGGEIREKSLRGFLQHAENLLPLIDELLKNDGLAPSDLGAILIGRGPGSFTGLRIGYATLKALLVRRKIPCFGVLSLDLIAWNKSPKEGERLAVCLDAHRGEFYTRLYEGREDTWVPGEEPASLNMTEAASRLSPDTAVTGNALDRFKKELSEKAPGIKMLAQEYWYPKASNLIRLFCSETEKNTFVQELKTPQDFLPRYFRLSEPEERRKARA